MRPRIQRPVRHAIDPTTLRLLRDVSAGIRVLQIRDGVDLTEKQILERARNIVMGLVGNYRIEAFEHASEVRADGSRRDTGRGDADRAESSFGVEAAALGVG